ncbi:phosphoglucosamine mutase [Merismopedia glauca]|uniref:Phosphoglucosamine mutase n=1 Tax=Merismopedia glauca CCAP 1448/3 TaxID=1296344 RepID=A0A2T1BXQ1_9CYAN|nr:phosphoglucosamine mutase [Merismopedia glauca]PSB00687.1 phosphoglucosamine mutase [Merismopedia glauca CCAP 1448/3]
MNLPATCLFGTDGIRGKVGDLLSAPLAMEVGFWAGTVLGKAGSGSIIVGQDSRNSSDMLASALAAGLTAAGLEVWNLGLSPTAAVAHLTSHTDAIGGVMISASHNPPEDNGIKFFAADGMKLPTDLQEEIEARLRNGDFAPKASTSWGRCYQKPELVKDYLEFLPSPLPTNFSLKGLKIVLDLAWGAAVKVAPVVFSQLGAEVICLHDRPDGDRINVGCGSTHLSQLQAAVKAHQADLGFAFDGDADRTIAVDSQGRAVDGDYILYFWGKALRQSGKLPHDLIVTTVMANLGFERAWEKLGGKLLRTPVGDRHVYAEMVATGAMLGGEQSGHILCPLYSVSGDGILTALHLAALVQESGTSLAEMVDTSFHTYPQILKNVRVEDRDRRLNWQDCQPLQQEIAAAEAAMGDAGRVLVRASGTEPLIRVMVEAATSEMTQEWTNRLVLVVEKHLI